MYVRRNRQTDGRTNAVDRQRENIMHSLTLSDGIKTVQLSKVWLLICFEAVGCEAEGHQSRKKQILYFGRLSLGTTRESNKSSGTAVYPHMPILREASMLDKSASTQATRAGRPAACGPTSLGCANRVVTNDHTIRFVRYFGLLAEQSSPKCTISHPWTPRNRPAKFDAPSFILGGEIRNQKHTHKITKKNKKQTNSKRYRQVCIIS